MFYEVVFIVLCVCTFFNLIYEYVFQNNLLRPKELHINTMRRYAYAAFQDGLDLPTLKTLASLACWGQHESNAERDFHRAVPFLYDCKFKTHMICVDTWNSDEAKIEPIQVPVLLASDVLHQLWEKNNVHLWETCIGATADKTTQFWSAFKRDPASSSWNHPVFEPASSN